MSGGSGSNSSSKMVNLSLTPEQAMDLMTALHGALRGHAGKSKDQAKADVAKSDTAKS